MDAAGALAFARENECRFVDLKFLDILGGWQHVTLPIRRLDEGLFTEGRALEGSALRGGAQGNTSQVRVVADPSSALIEPFSKARTLSITASLYDPATGKVLERDPRQLAKRAVGYAAASGICDEVRVSQEVEFFLFDDVRYDQTRNSSYFYVDADEGRVNTPREEAMAQGYRQTLRDAYSPAPPADWFADARTEMVEELLKLGLPVTLERHETTSVSHGAIDLGPVGLVAQADNLLWLKYVAKNVARFRYKCATFMPKPLSEEPGSSLPVGISLLKGGTDLFAGSGYKGLSQEAMWFIGGLIAHTSALCAFTNPTMNSYRRFAQGFDAPVNVAYSSCNRQVAVAVEEAFGREARTVRYRLPDPSANPYLAFAAILMAGLDGIERKLDPGTALDGDIDQMSQQELANVPVAPGGLEDALAALEEDGGFLSKGEVFPPSLIASWIELKMEGEINGARGRPTPLEYALYFDC